MPPFHRIVAKAVEKHGVHKKRAVFVLFVRQSFCAMPGAFVHKIKDRTHIELTKRFLLNKRQINCAAAGMAGFSGDIIELKKFRFFDVWVMNRFSCVVRKVLGPSGKIIYGALWAVSVVKL